MSGLFISFDSLPFLFSFLFLVFLSSPVFLFKQMVMSTKTEKEITFSIPTESLLSQKKIVLFLFKMIFFINFFSLFPHHFSGTALLSVSMSVALSFWGGVIFLKSKYLFPLLLQGVTPLGTPMGLMSFMVLIEISSQLIRPLTLMVRLAVNLMTGHLILNLLSFFSSVSFFSQSIFLLLEIMVSLVQAYVFALLLMLYLNE